MAQTSNQRSKEELAGSSARLRIGVLNKRKDGGIFLDFFSVGAGGWLDGWVVQSLFICFWEVTVLHRKGQNRVEFMGIEATLFCYPATDRLNRTESIVIDFVPQA